MSINGSATLSAHVSAQKRLWPIVKSSPQIIFAFLLLGSHVQSVTKRVTHHISHSYSISHYYNPEPPGDLGGCGRRLCEHIARLQRRIDAFDADL